MTNARSLANFATGIGTEGAVLTVDNTNNRIGIATTNPQNDLQVGLGITMEGDTGQVTFVGIVTAEGFRNSDGSVVGAASTDNINTGTAATFTSTVSIANSIFHVGDTNTAFGFPDNDTFVLRTAGSERFRVNSSGNVGIKTTTPNNTLTVGDAVQTSYAPSIAGNYIEIARTSGADAGLLINKNTGQWLIGIDNTDGANAPLRFEYGAAGSAHPGLGAGTLGMIMQHDGDIGIGTDNPGTVLDVRAGNWANGDIVVGEKDNAGRIKFRRGADGSDTGSIGFAAADNNNQLNINVGSADGVISFDTNTNEALRIDSNQRLLIGTESSQDKWNNSSGDHHLVQIESTSAFSQSWISHSTSATAGVQLDIGRSRGSDDGDTDLVSDGDLLGHLCFQGADGSQFVRGARISAIVNGTAAADDMPTDLIFETNSGGNNSAERLRITSGGQVNVGGDMDITGIATASQFDATSDVTLKENIAVIDEPITKLSELKGVTFDWKAGSHSVGVIAQDVEKVLPTAVGGNKDQKTVNYNAIIGLLVESVKDQQKQIEELKSLLDK